MFKRFALPAVLLFASALFAEDIFRDALILNEDTSHFFVTRTPDEMTVEGLHAFIDQYADTAVTHIFFCTGGGRVNVAGSVHQAIWEPNRDGVEPTEPWAVNAKLLDQRGIDPYTVWFQRCREKGISPWCSIRMNDVHCLNDLSNYMIESFTVSHPEFWRVPNERDGVWIYRALNFRHPEVRKYMTDLIDDQFQRYDFDGIELDWMRFGYHFTPGHEREDAHFVTEVVEHTRRAARQWSAKRGHPIAVAVRVPAVPEAAEGLGMDAVDWAKKDLVDLVIPCPFWTTTDFDIPLEQWNQALAGTNVSLAAAAEVRVEAYPGAEAISCTVDQLRGFAAAEKFRGTTNIYLFNWMDSGTPLNMEDAYHTMLREGFSDTFLATCPREVPLTFHDTVPPGVDSGAQLPKSTEEPAVFTIPSGPRPSGETGKIIVGLAEEQMQGKTFRAALGGAEPIAQETIAPDNIPGAKSALVFTFAREAFADGNNSFTLTQTEGDKSTAVFVAARFE
ncbi:MAG: family 10 glycosylhydrolase [Thermoguttaceae bacterium]|nr:family 10 glycosylhydrolase [Thermoguttaceae bacterium]